MSGTDQNTPAGKTGRRSRKAAPRNPKPKRPPGAQADQPEATEQPIDATLAPADTAPMEATAAAEAAAGEATVRPAELTLAEAVMAMEAAPIEVDAAADTAPIEAGAPADADAPAETPPIDMDAPAAPAPVSLQTIAKAYGDYTRKSLEETRSYVEKLRDVRSLDKAVEVQTEFARQAFEIFVAGSQKLYGLHKELAKQTLQPLERLADKPTRGQR